MAFSAGGDGGRRWPEVFRQRQRRTIVVLVISLVPQTPFKWKAELGSAFNTAYSTQLGNVTYYVTSREYGHPAYLEVRDPSGGLKRLDLGNYHKIEQAKQACERHYAAGCDLSRAERITH